MNPPMCKLCQKAHWLDADHDLSALEDVRALGAAVLRKSVTKRTPVTKLVPTAEERYESRRVVEEIRKGRPRQHKTNAERQRAYRERSQ